MSEADIGMSHFHSKPATERLSEFVSSASYEMLPDSAVALGKNALMDWLGVTVAGSNETGSRILAEYLKKAEARQEATVICHGFKTTAEFAALANGTTGHAIDFDDIIPEKCRYNMHPSACVVPAVLAVAEKYHMSGRQVLTAYAIGMEAIYGIGGAVGPAISRNGWHPTAVLGSLGAAAACANLLGLNKLQCQYALGIAASLAGGIRLNFGSMTKPMHAGNAARNGVVAAELAAAGFTSHPSVLEGEEGFCRMFGGGESIDWMPPAAIDSGEKWSFVSWGLAFKYYPSCRSTHSSIDAARHLRHSHSIKPDQIAEIVCKINPRHLNWARFIQPETGYQGKFSIPYCMAVALCNGNVTLADFDDIRVKDPLIRRVIDRVRIVHPPCDADGMVDHSVEVAIGMNDGQKYSCLVTVPIGEPENPITEEQLADKFRQCTIPILGERASARVLELARSFEAVEDLEPLLAILGGPCRG